MALFLIDYIGILFMQIIHLHKFLYIWDLGKQRIQNYSVLIGQNSLETKYMCNKIYLTASLLLEYRTFSVINNPEIVIFTHISAVLQCFNFCIKLLVSFLICMRVLA